MKKIFMLTLLSTLLVSSYSRAMEDEGPGGEPESPESRASRASADATLPEEELSASALEGDAEKSWVLVDPATLPPEPEAPLTLPGLMENIRSKAALATDVIAFYRQQLPIIEKLVKQDFGEHLQNAYEQLKATLSKENDLIAAFDTHQQAINTAVKISPGQIPELVESINKNLVELIKGNLAQYHLKYAALFWAINLSKFKDTPHADTFRRKAQEVITQIHSLYQEEYKDKLRGPAQVTNRAIGSISTEEQNNFLNIRLPKITNVQNKLFRSFLEEGQAIKDPLRIGMAFGGGGYRATILTAGYMEAFEKLGVLDSSLYISSLSGSTWYMAPWVFTGVSPSNYKNKLRTIITLAEADVRNRMTQEELKLSSDFLYDAILPKFVFDIPLSSVDLYGAFLADALLKQHEVNNKTNIDAPNRHALSLHMQWQMVKNGSVPFPLYTAVSENAVQGWYNWYEFNPLEVENVNLGFSIPSWAFGRKFSGGVSVPPQFPQEVSLGYLMGIFGSAYTINILHNIDSRHLKAIAGWGETIASYLTTLREATQETGRIYPAFVYNPWKDLPKAFLKEKEVSTSVAREEKFTFVDAGINYNIPLLPLLKGQRDLDVIIVGDTTKEGWVSVDGEIYPKEIAKFVASIQPWGITYHRAKNVWGIDIYIPEVTDQGSARNFVTRQPGGGYMPSPPIIVYFGFAKQPGFDFDPARHTFWNTFNFKYDAREFDVLSNLAQYTIERRKDVLLTTLWYAYKRRLWRKYPGTYPEPNLEEMLKQVPQPQLISENEKIDETKIVELQNTDNIFALFDRMWEYNFLYKRMDTYAHTQENLRALTRLKSKAYMLFVTKREPTDIMVPMAVTYGEKRDTTRLDICRYVLNLKGAETWKNEAVILKAYLDQAKRIVGSRDRLESKLGGELANRKIELALNILERAKNMLMGELKK